MALLSAVDRTPPRRTASSARSGIRVLVGLALLVAFWHQAPASAPPTEHDVKAAFVFNFVKLVSWPLDDTSSDPLVITVIGDSPITTALRTSVAGKRVRQRTIVVRTAATIPGPDSPCDVLIVAASALPAFREASAVLAKRPILTVGEGRAFLDAGGVIAFRVENDRVRFSIAPANAKQTGVRISSKLLDLAEIVEPTPATREARP